MQRSRMITLTLILSSLLLAVPGGTAAQDVDQRESMPPQPGMSYISTQDVETMLEAKGYQVGDVDLRGKAYEIEAIDVDGTPVLIRVDAHTGEILSEQRLENE